MIAKANKPNRRPSIEAMELLLHKGENKAGYPHVSIQIELVGALCQRSEGSDY
jgi:hypothetical protein